MSKRDTDALALLDELARRALSNEENRALSRACSEALVAYRAAVAGGRPSRGIASRARKAFLHLGGDPGRSTASLKDYDHDRYGPFLGVSDEGSAAAQIRGAAYESPKVRALPRTIRPSPLQVGLALDAERLGGIGEVAVGPEEYADIWLECVDRLLVTTNIGTRVNVRTYRREPRVVLTSAQPGALARAKEEIAAAFKPFVETPDGRPRPLTVFVEIPRSARITRPKQKAALIELVAFVASGKGVGKKRAPVGHVLGFAVAVGRGLEGRDAAMDGIELAAIAGIGIVRIDGQKRRVADEAISLAGLLDYFEPGIVGPLLRRAHARSVHVRCANLPDTDTIARSIWVGLATARSMGANLGKYGCFPLTRPEIDHVVEQVQSWLPSWSAAPVFFVDQGLLHEAGVDVGNDLPRGMETWLDTVARHGVKVVLIDTVDKATGKRLLKRSAKDATGFLGPNQIQRIERYARKKGIKALWAGGLGLADAFAMGKLGVFGIYVTSAAATTVPVPATGSYVRDPALAGVKEPSKEAVLRTKILLEAGFLSAKLGARAERITRTAERLLEASGAGNANTAQRHTAALALACTKGWRTYWKTEGR